MNRRLTALAGASRTHPQLVRETLDKMAADLDKPCPHIVDLFTRPTPEGDGFCVEIVFPAKPSRRRVVL